MRKLINKIGVLFLIVVLTSCRGLNTNFGNYYLNENKEVNLTDIGYYSKQDFQKKFKSYTKAYPNDPLPAFFELDSIKLSKQHYKKLNLETHPKDTITSKKQIAIIGISDKQDLINDINKSFEINDNPLIKPKQNVVTSIALISNSELQKLYNADSYYYHFNKNTKAHEIIYYIDGEKNIKTIKPKSIIAYQTMTMCWKEEYGKIVVESLTSKSCPAGTSENIKKSNKSIRYDKL